MNSDILLRMKNKISYTLKARLILFVTKIKMLIQRLEIEFKETLRDNQRFSGQFRKVDSVSVNFISLYSVI